MIHHALLNFESHLRPIKTDGACYACVNGSKHVLNMRHVTYVAAQSMAAASTALFYTLRKAEFLIGTRGLVSVAACSGRTFSLTLLKILRACALTFSTLSNIKCDFEVQHGEPVKKKCPASIRSH